MAASSGAYKVYVYYNYGQCDVSSIPSSSDGYYDASITPTVTYTFTPKLGCVISDITIKSYYGVSYTFVSENQVRITASSDVVNGNNSGIIHIEVTTKEDIRDLSTLFTKIANAIRAKKGTTAAIKATDFPSSIQALPVLDTSDATATAANILSGKTAYVNGTKLTGTIASKTASDLTVSGAKVTVPAGHYAIQATKSVATATQATPSISVDSAGKITASATQTAGYVAAGTKSATKQLTTQAAQTIMPGKADETIDSGKYLTGTQTIKGDENLEEANIIKGISIFGVAGSFSVAGKHWTAGMMPSGFYWRSVTYGGGKFVAVARNGNRAAYSTDGRTWTAATLPPNTGWQSVTYGGGKFVAVADNGQVAYSTDGITWTAATLPPNTGWQSVTYGGGKFVAVADNGQVAYSTDGITWTAATLPRNAYWQSVTYGGGKFVAVGNSEMAYSPNGISWTNVDISPDDGSWIVSPDDVDWQSVTYGGGKFVAVADNSSNVVYSTDGVKWKNAILPSSASWRSVTYGGGKFVAVDNNGNRAAYSTDGITWTAATLPQDTYWQSVTYGGGKFVAVDSNFGISAYSKYSE